MLGRTVDVWDEEIMSLMQREGFDQERDPKALRLAILILPEVQNQKIALVRLKDEKLAIDKASDKYATDDPYSMRCERPERHTSQGQNNKSEKKKSSVKSKTS
jgi:hypothetical protein